MLAVELVAHDTLNLIFQLLMWEFSLAVPEILT
jgi:hypothetical protein